MTMESSLILTERIDPIAIITLNRPDKRNALSPELIRSFITAFDLLEADDQIKVIMITGSGKSFCAGADLEYLHNIDRQNSIFNEQDSKLISSLFSKIYDSKKVTVAAVNGSALAGGCGLASVCDFIVASEKHAKFGYPEVKIGFIPAIVSYYLIQRVGNAKAKQILISGKIYEPEEALQIGLVDYNTDDVIGFSKTIASEICKNSSNSVAEIKMMMRNISGLDYRDATQYCENLNTILRASSSFTEGLKRFLTK